MDFEFFKEGVGCARPIPFSYCNFERAFTSETANSIMEN